MQVALYFSESPSKCKWTKSSATNYFLYMARFGQGSKSYDVWESCCARAERPCSESAKVSSPLAFYFTIVSPFCWKKKKKRAAALRTAGFGCIFVTSCSGKRVIAYGHRSTRRTTTVLLPQSCRLAYPMPLWQ